MGKKFSCVLLLTALLAGCAAGEPAPPDRSEPPERPAAAAEPVVDGPREEIFVEAPDSPYPMTVESWQVDMDGDGVEELVELRAEKSYWGSEQEPGTFIEEAGSALHPYALAVSRGESVWELPLGWKAGGSPVHPCVYFDNENTGRCWTRDRSGNPVLVMWFDTISAGGMGNLDVYAAAFQNRNPILLPIPRYSLQCEFDPEAMEAQLTVPETGYTQCLDLKQWLADYTQQARQRGLYADGSFVYLEDGTLDWPTPPTQIDGWYQVEQAGEGVVLRQYTSGRYHSDGIADLATTLSWQDGQAVVLDQRFEWLSYFGPDSDI